MSLITKFELKASASDGSELRRFLSKILADTRTFSGCESAEFGTSETADDAILLIEKWHSKEAFNAYLNWRIEIGDFAKLGLLLAEAPSVTHFMTH